MAWVAFEFMTNSQKASSLYKWIETEYSSDEGNALDIHYIKSIQICTSTSFPRIPGHTRLSIGI